MQTVYSIRPKIIPYEVRQRCLLLSFFFFFVVIISTTRHEINVRYARPRPLSRPTQYEEGEVEGGNSRCYAASRYIVAGTRMTPLVVAVKAAWECRNKCRVQRRSIARRYGEVVRMLYERWKGGGENARRA